MGSETASRSLVRARVALAVRDEDLANRTAGVLREHGFEVLSIGSRGVDFEGTPTRFGEVFEVRTRPTDDGVRVEGTPVVPPDFPEGVESVYIPTKPQRFP